MTSQDETQDEPIMDGATEASAAAQHEGKEEQAAADVTRDSALEDSVRSVRALGEDRTA